MEVDKNRKITDEINICQRRIISLESELNDAKMMSNQPYDEMQHMQRDLDNLVRENENFKRRYILHGSIHNFVVHFGARNQGFLSTDASSPYLVSCFHLLLVRSYEIW